MCANRPRRWIGNDYLQERFRMMSPPLVDVRRNPGIEIDLLKMRDRSLGIGAGQEKQRLRQPIEMADVLGQAGKCRAVFGSAAVAAQGDFHLSQHCREWSAELVGRIACEPPLTFESFLQTIERTVKGAA